VTCGTAACDTTTQFCCVTFNPSESASCLPLPDASNPCPGGGTELFCDKGADCPAGQQCVEESLTPLFTGCRPAGSNPNV